MSKGPESNFWKQIRNNLPEKCFATRIENKHGGGVPDVHMVWDGKAFWFELKVTKGNAVNISPHQVAWNMAYYARGGSNFYLVKRAVDNHLFLFEGDQGPSLSQSGISGAEGHEFAALAALWDFLAARLAARGAAFIPCGSTNEIKTARA